VDGAAWHDFYTVAHIGMALFSVTLTDHNYQIVTLKAITMMSIERHNFTVHPIFQNLP